MQNPEPPPPYNTQYPGQMPPPAGQYIPPAGQYMPPTTAYYPSQQGQTAGYYGGDMKPPPAGTYVPQGQGFPGQGYPGQPAGANTTVIVTQMGNCPNCHVGNLVEGFSLCGIIMAILFFPIGILCCLMMQEKKCSHCGAEY